MSGSSTQGATTDSSSPNGRVANDEQDAPSNGENSASSKFYLPFYVTDTEMVKGKKWYTTIWVGL